MPLASTIAACASLHDCMLLMTAGSEVMPYWSRRECAVMRKATPEQPKQQVGICTWACACEQNGIRMQVLFVRGVTLKIGEEISWGELAAPCVKAVPVQQECRVKSCMLQWPVHLRLKPSRGTRCSTR